MTKKILLACLAACLLVLIAVSCQKEEVNIQAEPVKTIDGSWRIIKALRNGTDMTQRFDFSKFRINFADSSYTLSNQVPFLVSRNGTWTFDDPVYPFRIAFTAPGDSARSSTVLYPVVNGVRNIIVTFSPGCNANTYQYTLQKD